MQRKKRKTVIFTALFLAITLVPVPSNAVVKDNLADNMLLQLFTELGGQKRNKVPESEEDFDSATLAEKVNYLEDTSAKKQDVSDLITKKDLEGLPEPKEAISEYTWEEIDKILSARRAAEYGLGKVGAELRDSYCVLDSRHYSLKIVAPRREDMQFLDVAKKICRTQYLDFNSEIGVNLAHKSQLPLPRDFKGLCEGFNFGTLHCSWTALKDFEGLHTESDKTQFSLVGYGSYFSLNYEDEILRYIPTYWIGEKKDYLPRIKESTKYSWREISIILEEGLAAEDGIAKDGTQLRDGWVTTRCQYVDGQNYLHIWKPTTEFGRGNLYRAFNGLVDKYNQEFGYPVVFDINVPTIAELTTDALASYRKSASHVDFWLADAGTDSTDDKETRLYVKADGSIASSPINGNIIHYVMPVLYLY